VRGYLALFVILYFCQHKCMSIQAIFHTNLTHLHCSQYFQEMIIFEPFLTDCNFSLCCYRRMNASSTCAALQVMYVWWKRSSSGGIPTTLTNQVNALTTELQKTFFSMYSYSIKFMVLFQGTQNSTPVPVLCYCVSFLRCLGTR
jgi:hypothetical protein